MDIEVYNKDNKKVLKKIKLSLGLKYGKCDIDIKNVIGYNLSDKQLEEYLMYKYIKKGIIPKIILHEENIESDKNYYIRYTIPYSEYQEMIQLNFILPDKLMISLNKYLDYINNYLILIEDNFKKINNTELQLVQKQNDYRINSDYEKNEKKINIKS